MIGNIVARRYAKALFALGQKKGTEELEVYGRDLTALSEALAGAPEAMRVFRTPVFSVEQKKAVMDKILEKASVNQTVRNFCLLLADKNRLDQLPEIAGIFAEYLDAVQGILRGDLVTAVALDEGRQGALKEKLEKQTGRQLVLGYEVDPEILGGVVLKVGDQVLDASIRAQLSILKENMKWGE